MLSSPPPFDYGSTIISTGENQVIKALRPIIPIRATGETGDGVAAMPIAEDKRIGTFPTGQGTISKAAGQQVVTRTIVDDVPATGAGQRIAGIGACDLVDLAPGPDLIIRAL